MFNNQSFRSISHLVLAALAISLVTGCATTKFGGRLVPVTLDSDPQGDSAYLIPNDRFLADPSIATNKQRLDDFYQGKTPSTVRIPPYLWVYVAARPDGAISNPFTFNPTNLEDGRVLPEWP